MFISAFRLIVLLCLISKTTCDMNCTEACANGTLVPASNLTQCQLDLEQAREPTWIFWMGFVFGLEQCTNETLILAGNLSDCINNALAGTLEALGECRNTTEMLNASLADCTEALPPPPPPVGVSVYYMWATVSLGIVVGILSAVLIIQTIFVFTRPRRVPRDPPTTKRDRQRTYSYVINVGNKKRDEDERYSHLPEESAFTK